MHGEKASHKTAAPGESRRLVQQQKKQEYIERVPENTLRVMSRRLEPEQRNVEHVRDPRDRMPIRFIGRSERPSQSGRRQSPLDVKIGSHIGGIVIVDEIVVQN